MSILKLSLVNIAGHMSSKTASEQRLLPSSFEGVERDGLSFLESSLSCSAGRLGLLGMLPLGAILISHVVLTEQWQGQLRCFE